MEDDEILMIMNKIIGCKPCHSFKKISNHETGFFAVIKFLSEHDDAVKSKDISEELGVSSARTAVLLKKLTEKGLIEKFSFADDARVTLVRLTQQGDELARKMHKNLYALTQELIEEFGINYLIKLLDDLARFKTVVERNHQKLEEDLHD